MPVNLLTNPSFEDGWTDDGNRQIPNGWEFWYATHGDYVPPEMRHLTRTDVPANEHDLFWWNDSKYTLHIFARSGTRFWLGQTIHLEPGHYSLMPNIFPDLVDRYEDGDKIPAPDPLSGRMSFLVDDDAGPWFPMTPFLERHTYSYDFPAGLDTFVGAEFDLPHPLESNGIFTDAWSLVRLDEPEPEPERPKYYRTIHLVPQDTTDVEMEQVVERARPNKQSITYSVHDAVIRHPDMLGLTVYAWDVFRIAGGPEELENFAEIFYPPLPNIQYRGFTSSPPPPPPPPPAALGELLTLHLQTEVDGWLEYVAAVKPQWVKLVGNFEIAQRIKEESSETNVLARFYTGHEPPTIDWAAIDRNLNWLDAVENENEMIATHDIPGIESAVQRAVVFSDFVHSTYGNDLAACLLNPGVGNPDHGIETEMLLPAAEVAVQNNHYLGYHAYFPGHPTHAERWMEEYRYDFHMRAMDSWDSTFSNHGLRPKYLLTECGAVAAADNNGEPGGMNFLAGWRDPLCLNGDWPRYLVLLMRWREMLNEWNAQHENRVECATLFTQGDVYVGWEHFKLWRDELEALAGAV